MKHDGELVTRRNIIPIYATHFIDALAKSANQTEESQFPFFLKKGIRFPPLLCQLQGAAEFLWVHDD